MTNKVYWDPKVDGFHCENCRIKYGWSAAPALDGSPEKYQCFVCKNVFDKKDLHGPTRITDHWPLKKK